VTQQKKINPIHKTNCRFSFKDFIVLSMYPSEPAKALFKELRQVIPVRLTSDPWTPDGSGRAGLVVNGFGSSECSLSFADGADDEHPEVFYAQ
jgi:hypothetical protein